MINVKNKNWYHLENFCVLPEGNKPCIENDFNTWESYARFIKIVCIVKMKHNVCKGKKLLKTTSLIIQ